MSKFHVNTETGAVGVCTATKKCPFGGPEIHFSDEESAKKHSETLLEAQHPESGLRKGKGKLIILSGLPVSGKSTLAAKMAKELDAKLVNRDDQRTEMFGESYHSKNPDRKSEAAVTAILRNRMLKALREGRTVIEDNTNMNPRFLGSLVAEARKVGAEIEFIAIDVPIEVAKERNRKRGAAGGRLVPDFVIDSMAKNAYSEDGHIKDIVASKKGFVFFVAKETNGMRELAKYNRELEEANPILSKNLVIIDIDGTLAVNHEMADRHLRQPNVKKNFQGFYEDSVNAEVNTSVVALSKEMRASGLTLFALTGRSDNYADLTTTFLRRTEAPISRVLMAREGDFRGDHDTKSDAVDRLQAEGFQIVHAIDDRPTSIDVWRNRGVLVSAVPYGEHPSFPTDGSQPQVAPLFIEGFCVKCGKPTDGEIIHKECSADA